MEGYVGSFVMFYANVDENCDNLNGGAAPCRAGSPFPGQATTGFVALAGLAGGLLVVSVVCGHMYVLVVMRCN